MNPAQSLYDFLITAKEGVRSGNGAASTARALDTENGMEEQLQAAIDLAAVKAGIDQLEIDGYPVATYRKYIRLWSDMVFSYPEGWMSGIDPDAAYPVAILDHLHTLVGWFSAARRTPSEQGQRELRSFLGDVQQLLDEDQTISPQLHQYLSQLIGEMLNALDDEQLLGRFDFNDAGRRLWTALFAASAQSEDPEKKTLWADLGNKLWWPTAAGVLGSAPSIITGVLTATGHS